MGKTGTESPFEDALLERNRNLNRGFRKLVVWRESVEVYTFIKKELNRVNGLSFRIRDQVLASAFSISSNLAEGYCRKSIKEYVQFINIALGSAGENYSQMYALLRSQEISKEIFDEFDNLHYSVENKLINLAKSLSRKIKNNADWNSNYKV